MPVSKTITMRIAVCCPHTNRFKTQQSLKTLLPHSRAWAVLSKLYVDPSRQEVCTTARGAAQEPMDGGKDTTCYDNALVIGDVMVGEHTWIGPNVVFD